ncbi:MAG: FUSC family protein, partial [Actinomycetes bacterium]
MRIAPGELRARGGDRARRELRRRWARLAATAPAILQCAVAAGLAWLVAAELLGHPRPFFAPVAAVICIGVAAGRRLPRLVELVAGVSLGVGVGDLLVLRIGSGAWQIALVVALAMAVAVFLGSGTVLTIQAASSAVLVATLLPPTGSGGLHRMIDTFVGGVLGIVAVALLPPDLVAATRRDAREIFDALADTLTETARGMAERDAARVSAVLDEARAGQRAFARFTAGLTAAQEVASISPLRRRHRRALRRYAAASAPLDRALGNARVLARRTLAAIWACEPIPPSLPDGLHRLARAVRLLQADLERARDPEEVRR